MYIPYACHQFNCKGLQCLDIGVVKEFRVTDCAQHFCKYFSRIDRIICDLRNVLAAILIAFGFEEAFCLH